MNKNMSAIGFKEIEKKRKTVSEIVRNIKQNSDKTVSYVKKDGKTTVEQYGYVGESFGLILYGSISESEEVRIRRWNIFASSKEGLNISNLSFDKLSNGDVYAYCEEDETGTELEFRLNNIIEYEKFRNKTKIAAIEDAVANIVALGRVGNIIFPVEKSEDALRIRAEENETRRKLIKRLRRGDEAAEQKLFDHSVEIASTVRERLKTEDVLSVFEGYCLPYGEADGSYALLGDIEEIDECDNVITGEMIYNIQLDVTGVKLKMLINKKDVVGMPMKGMRFMGICDLQGTIKFI